MLGFRDHIANNCLTLITILFVFVIDSKHGGEFKNIFHIFHQLGEFLVDTVIAT